MTSYDRTVLGSLVRQRNSVPCAACVLPKSVRWGESCLVDVSLWPKGREGATGCNHTLSNVGHYPLCRQITCQFCPRDKAFSERGKPEKKSLSAVEALHRVWLVRERSRGRCARRAGNDKIGLHMGSWNRGEVHKLVMEILLYFRGKRTTY